MDKHAGSGGAMIGADKIDCTACADTDSALIHQTNTSFWDTKGTAVLGATALPLYGAFVSEERHRLFGDVAGKRVLEIGCGSGESLRYLGERGAGELWGMDISSKQLETARQNLRAGGYAAKLICSPMEEDCGIPEGYFDFVYSVYAIGWTSDLDGTFRRIASYLKQGGTFIFSWSHPIHKCVCAENGVLTFQKCYFDESWYSLTLEGAALTLSDRKLSSYINALAQAGFVVEQMIEDSDEDMLQGSQSAFAQKAKMLPVTFVIKARKP